MKINNEFIDYLKGNKFSNGYFIQYDYYQPIPDRVSFLRDLVRNKKVLHLGCLDHLQLIENKIKRNQWLHKELTSSSSICLGIDIEEEAKEYVQSRLGFNNILLGDFTQDTFPEVSSRYWDYVILGELLEHIDNPVAFLKSIHTNYATNIRNIVITVPNAWTQITMANAKKSKEIINSDHRFWFTPYTISKVIMQAGMEIEEIHFANRIPLKIHQLVYRKIISMAGMEPKYNFTYASSIIAIAKL